MHVGRFVRQSLFRLFVLFLYKQVEQLIYISLHSYSHTIMFDPDLVDRLSVGFEIVNVRPVGVEEVHGIVYIVELFLREARLKYPQKPLGQIEFKHRVVESTTY